MEERPGAEGPSPPQYFIQSGVRRSVAAREVGQVDIAAILFDPGSPPVVTRIPLDRLHSPKPLIPEDHRYLTRNLWPAQRGSTAPPIEVEPLGLPGQGPATRLKDVRLEP